MVRPNTALKLCDGHNENINLKLCDVRTEEQSYAMATSKTSLKLCDGRNRKAKDLTRILYLKISRMWVCLLLFSVLLFCCCCCVFLPVDAGF